MNLPKNEANDHLGLRDNLSLIRENDGKFADTTGKHSSDKEE